MRKTNALKPVLYYLPFHVAIAAITWRDIHRRPAGKIRGSKRLWRIASAVNTLGAAGYWLAARRLASCE
ncbi:MAG TPA: hypothetical protein VNN74_07345 [Candidatus Micrarchaeia archaeon]|nr:hypothetical protein [Candidatus Micrarchaeia archaeon]